MSLESLINIWIQKCVLHLQGNHFICLLLQLRKLKEHSDEQKERAETAEFQIATISLEYRKLVESKDAEIRQLKTVSEKWKEEVKYHHTPDPHSPLKELAQLQFSSSQLAAEPGGEAVGRSYTSVDIGGDEEWTGHYEEDFSDVISSQAEINRLRLELTKVKTELQHWKMTAGEKVCFVLWKFHT